MSVRDLKAVEAGLFGKQAFIDDRVHHGTGMARSRVWLLVLTVMGIKEVPNPHGLAPPWSLSHRETSDAIVNLITEQYPCQANAAKYPGIPFLR
jgi:hypothetical protein